MGEWNSCAPAPAELSPPAQGGLLHDRERVWAYPGRYRGWRDEYVMKPFDRETLESKLQIVGVACFAVSVPAVRQRTRQSADDRRRSPTASCVLRG
jgi:hypothetical protein